MNEENKYLEWVLRLAIPLAIRHLKDAQNDKGEWPGEQEWHDLVGTSQTIFIKMALNDAGISYQEYMAALSSYFEKNKGSGKYFDKIWEDFEKKEQDKMNVAA